MTSVPTRTHAPEGPQTAPVDWMAVGSVMAGIFAIVTAEILPIGLLTPVAGAFAISEGTAGLMMTVPGIVAAIAAPLVTVATRHRDRRTMLCALVVLLAASDVVCAVAGSFWLILAARVLVGLVIGGFWSIGAGLADRLVAPHHVARATAIIFSAVPLGSVLGVPLGTFVADLAGWRVAFVALGGLTVVVLVALMSTLPRLPARLATDLGVLRGLLRRRTVWVGLGATFLVVLAHFGTYTYVTPFLLQVTHLDLGVVSTLLLVYGAAGVVGNVVAGSTIVRHLQATWASAAAMIAVATLLLPLLGGSIAGAALLLVVWGLAYGAVPVCSQTFVARSSPSGEAATVLFTSSFQATISVGALLGGALLDAGTVVVVMLAGGVVAVATAALVLVAGRPASAPSAQEEP